MIACRTRSREAIAGQASCAPLALAPSDEIYVTTAIKQERLDPDAGFQLNFYRDVWAFCFIVVRGDTSAEYMADFRRGVVGPSLEELNEDRTDEPARVLVSLADNYVDLNAKNGCDWLWRFTETPQKG